MEWPGFHPLDINATYCTHSVLEGAILSDDRIYPPQTDSQTFENYVAFNTLKKANPLMKTFLQVHGTNKTFSSITSTTQKAGKFSKDCINYLREAGFDGMILRWYGRRGSPFQDGIHLQLLLRVSRSSLIKEYVTINNYLQTSSGCLA